MDKTYKSVRSSSRRRGDGVKGMDKEIVILAIYKFPERERESGDNRLFITLITKVL